VVLDHRLALHLEHVELGAVEAALEAEVLVVLGDRLDRPAGGDAADDGQALRAGLLGLGAERRDRRVAEHLDGPVLAALPLDQPALREGRQVVVDRGGRAQAEGRADFADGGRVAVLPHVAHDEVVDFILAVGAAARGFLIGLGVLIHGVVLLGPSIEHMFVALQARVREPSP
jgi:hypothetical protein